MSAKTLMTVEDFAALSTSETEDFELIDGELIPISSGNPMHGFVRGRIEFAIQSYLKLHPIGRVVSEIDCRLFHDTVRRPDVSIFLGDRIRTIDPRQVPVPFAPDIAVEVLSRSESAIDVNRKTLHYLAANTREVWQVDYENVVIFIRTNDGILLRRGEAALETPLLPGFSAALSTLLAPF
jgi:Uma2 family endonuclease